MQKRYKSDCMLRAGEPNFLVGESAEHEDQVGDDSFWNVWLSGVRTGVKPCNEMCLLSLRKNWKLMCWVLCRVAAAGRRRQRQKEAKAPVIHGVEYKNEWSQKVALKDTLHVGTVKVPLTSIQLAQRLDEHWLIVQRICLHRNPVTKWRKLWWVIRQRSFKVLASWSWH